MGTVSVRNVRKPYGAVPVLHGVSVDIKDGEFVVLVGPSVCGKSTLLRMIAGLEDISSGEIAIDAASPARMSRGYSASALRCRRGIALPSRPISNVSLSSTARAAGGSSLVRTGWRHDDRTGRQLIVNHFPT
jgi:ABC-type phosphate/phosphonate transport system ATPase subunit